MSKLLVVDPTRCTGCQACEATCSTIRTGQCRPGNSRISVLRFPDRSFNYPLVCQQCEKPACAIVCPTAALTRNGGSGVVELDEERCIGCKMCLLACPFGAITWVEGKPAKCDLCDGDPACVRLCEPRAISLGEPDALVAARRQVLAGRIRESFLNLEESK